MTAECFIDMYAETLKSRRNHGAHLHNFKLLFNSHDTCAHRCQCFNNTVTSHHSLRSVARASN